MIVVKAELWPFGNEEAARELDRLIIANQGNHILFPSGVQCDYSYDFLNRNAKGDVQHIREAGVWELIRRVLSDANG